ncbi:MAG: hypothetical protein ABL883_10020 [Terricaulis sp.]
MASAEYAVLGPVIPRGFMQERHAAELVFQRPETPYDGTMPRIPDSLMEGIAFLYPTADLAHKRERLGGTAFLVGREIVGGEEAFGQAVYLPYLVSNRHVVFEGSACVASVNRRDGSPPHVCEIDQNEWVAHPEHDLAAACAYGHIDLAVHRISHIREARFLTPKIMEDSELGVGDEAFMVGRFVNLQGSSGDNRPAARFGTLSMMIENIPTTGPIGAPVKQESFAVEMRSRTGFSGSPVIVYRTAATVLRPVPDEYAGFFALLGVNWGYIKDETGENSFINGVIPAWRISELLDLPALRAYQQMHEDRVAKIIKDKKKGEPDNLAQPTALTAYPKIEENPRHKEDFNRLLGAAVGKPKRGGQT